MKKKDIIYLLEHTVNAFECLRDSNYKSNLQFDDDYFLGKSQAYDLAAENLTNLINAVKK